MALRTTLVSKAGLLSEVGSLDLARFRDSRSLTHGLFRFPGRFHPPLIAYLLTLHPEAQVIGDPMVGSGTAAVETVASGKAGLFSDIDPLSCMLARAKSRPVDPNWLTETIESIAKKAKIAAPGSVSRAEARVAVKNMEASTPFRAPPDIFHWFQPYVVKSLCNSLSEASEFLQSRRRSDAVLAVFAAIMRRVSRADPSTASGLEVTSVRKKALKNGLKFDVESELRRKARLLANGYREIRKVQKMGSAKITKFDVRHWGDLCSKLNMWPDLIITSPCYMSAIEYWRRHKLEYCLLGLVRPDNLASLKGEFLGMGGSEPKLDELPPAVREMYNGLLAIKRNRDAEALARYFHDSRQWLSEIRRVLEKSQGTAYVVVGGNTNHGVRLDTPLALQEIASEIGLSPSTFSQYRIKNSYMQYPTNGSRIKTETILKLVQA